MFYPGSATTIEMAYTAVLNGGWPHTLGHLDQVHRRIRHSCTSRNFLIATGLVVTDQAVNIVTISEIEAVILPAVAYMTAGATGPV